MKLMSYDKYMKLSKPALIRKITKALRAMPKAKLARLCYNITKSKLPRLTIRKRKQLARIRTRAPRIKLLKKASPKQIEWRKKFAKMSRAGTLRRR